VGGAAMAASRKQVDVQSSLDRGLVRYALGRRDEAIRLWQAALSVEPENERALDYLRSVGALPPLPELGSDTDEVDAVDEDTVLVDRPQLDMPPPFTQEVAAYEPDDDEDDKPPREPVVPDVEILAREALDLAAEERWEGALKSAEEALRRDPEHAEARRLVREIRGRLEAEYLAELEPLDRVPVLRATDASILELSLDPIGGFLISQIDGEITIEELLTILGTFDQYRVLSSLHFFLENGIIELR
jgi:tetratricopeptide (TPR) repeat protein